MFKKHQYSLVFFYPCRLGIVDDLKTLDWSLAWQFPEVALQDLRKLTSMS